MSWQHVVLLCIIGFNALCTIALNGKRREPITPRQVCITLVVQAAIAALVVTG